jgi:hypothetical protein
LAEGRKLKVGFLMAVSSGDGWGLNEDAQIKRLALSQVLR